MSSIRQKWVHCCPRFPLSVLVFGHTATGRLRRVNDDRTHRSAVSGVRACRRDTHTRALQAPVIFHCELSFGKPDCHLRPSHLLSAD